ncbi:MAG: ATP-dependent Clp protease ATP-binding subunit ClpX, partial [Chitinophagaceae bacterium]
KLHIEDDVFDFMVEKAVEYKLGARGLRSICESILTDAMFELPSSSEKFFTLDLDYAKRKFDKSKMSLLKVA